MAAESEGAEQPKGMSRVEKMDTTCQRYCNFTLMDTVEDGVRVRMLNVWAFLLVYIFFVFGLLKTGQKLASEVTVIEVSTPMSKFAYTNGIMGVLAGKSAKVTPMVGIFDSNGNAVQGASAELAVVDFYPLGPLPCSLAELEAAENTLETLRYKDSCNFSAINGSSTAGSSDIGLASFDALEFSGPAGVYTFAVKHKDVAAGSQEKVTVSTPVATLKVVDPDDLSQRLPAPFTAIVGQPLVKQPAILISDDNGLPLANRYVTAFANADPTWPPDPTLHETPSYYHRGQKFAELSCATSLPSDEQGIARFTCLGVKGSTTNTIYFVFSESGFVFNPWNDPAYSPENLYTLSIPRYRYPTRIVTKVSSVQALNSGYPQGVREGTPLSPQPVLRLLDSSGDPVPNTLCYAIVTAASGHYLPLYFRRQRRGHRHKEILNGRAMTDANGLASFSNLSVSGFGNTLYEEGMRPGTESSIYIGFVCDGKFPADPIPWDEASRGFLPEVNSKVAKVIIQRFTQDTAYVTPYHMVEQEDTSFAFTAVVRVVDANGTGVSGKTVIVEEATEDIVVLNMVANQEPTSHSGFAVVSFAVVAAPLAIRDSGNIAVQVRFKVDGVVSATSQQLTARLNGVYNPSLCHMLFFAHVSAVDIVTGNVQNFDPFSETPYALSGSIFAAAVVLMGQTTGNCVYYPELALGSINKSNCVLGDGRRLRDSLVNNTLHPDTLRRLRESSSGNSSASRRLASSSDGSVKLNVLSGYSDKGIEECNAEGECEIAVKYQPRELFDVKVTDQLPLESLASVSTQPSFLVTSVMTLGPAGDHFLKFKATLTPPTAVGPPQTCYSPPLNVRILNRLAKLGVLGDGDRMFTKQILPTRTLDIKVKFYPQDPETLQPRDPSTADPHFLASSKWEFHGVYWKWVEVPANVANLFDTDAVPPPNATGMYTMEEAAGSAWDSSQGTLSLKLTLKMPGVFGRFALQFGAAGLWSRVFTFEVVAPSRITLSVIQAPAFAQGEAELPTQTYLPVQPIVKVKVDGAPLEGAVVVAELVPEDGAVFSRFTDIPMVSPLPLIYSAPSDADGNAVWYQLAVLDGTGCAKFKFVLIPDEVETEPVPNEPLCFKPAYSFVIKVQPPASLPIEVRMDQINGAELMEVEAHVQGSRVPSLVCPHDVSDPEVQAVCPHPGYQFFVMRVVVTEAGGETLNMGKAKAASRTMLSEQVCVWVFGMELKQRCSNLELVQLDPYGILRFRIQRLSWSKVTVSPAEIKLMISDLSGSAMLTKIEAPDGFANVSPLLRAPACMDGLLTASTMQQRYTTGVIKAETAAASANVVLPPPQVVDIGRMFLVRLQLLTKYGSGLANRPMRVCIIQASSMSPSILSPAFLQALGNNGFTMDSACGSSVRGSSKAMLLPSGTIRTSGRDGTVSFPLTVMRGPSGTYKLLFAPEMPGAQVLAESVAFKVFNPITAVSSGEDSWGTIEVEAFGERVLVPRSPVFRVTTDGGQTLEDLEAEGIRVKVELELRGVSEKRIKAQELVMELRKQAAAKAAEEATKAVNKAKAAVLSIASLAATAASSFIANETDGIFSMFSDEFRELCEPTAVVNLASGATSGQLNGNLVQQTSMSDEVVLDPSVIDPAAMLGQFVGTLTAGGQEMQSAEMMQPMLSLDLGIDALVNVGNNTYTLRDQLYMRFNPGFQYQLLLHVNGVTGAKEDFPPFIVKIKELPPEEVAFNWFVSAIAAIIAAIVLATNTMKHRARWFAFAIIATVAVSIAVPFLKEYRDAMGGHWNLLALADLILIFFTLLYGLFLELLPGKIGLTFQQRRIMIYEEYAERRFGELMREVELPKPKLKENIKAMFKPFSSKDAFYYPSNLLCAGFISTGSFLWIFWQVVVKVQDVNDALNALLNRAISAILRKLASINNQVFAAIGQDIPDESIKFMYKQLDIVTGWFRDLINAIYAGVWIGIALAFLITAVMTFYTFYDFRRRALKLRQGREHIGQKGIQVKFSASFIGLFISSTVIGFLGIVLIVTLLVLPLSWPILWNMIWGFRWMILSIVAPALITPIVTFVFKFCAFGNDFFKNRALAAAFFFWQTYVSIIGGIASAIVRFVIGIVGVLLMLPCIAGANTPDTLNKVALLDAPFKSYLSAVLTYHVLNAPIFAVAASRLLRICKTKLEFKKNGKLWPKSKNLVLLLLIRFPQLRQYRKAAIQAAKEEDKARKKAEKGKKDESKTNSNKASDVTPAKNSTSSSKLNSEIDRLCKEIDRANKDLEKARSIRRELSRCESGSPEAKEVLTRVKATYGEDESKPVQVQVASKNTEDQQDSVHVQVAPG